MGIVIFFAVVIAVVLVAAGFFDYRRRKARRTGEDWQTSQHPTKPREGKEFRHGPPGGVGSG